MGSAPERYGRAESLGHYWFLTFEHQRNLHRLAEKCRRIANEAHFAPTPTAWLHLTLDRIARCGESTREQLEAIAASAEHLCRNFAPLELTIDRTIDLHGALGFAVAPGDRVTALRDAIRTATLSVLPDAPVRDSSSPPHITIAYPKSEGQSLRAGECERITFPVTEVALVALEHRDFSYRWDVVTRVGLGRG
ncbi:2'-5' RNA ligase family protein [Nocardia asteroides]|uniref:2'-5' RNA ligase family protein n=1 Tax=Nocardia asteroides TaxID=1824 RepID=UPI001E5A2EB9|nr:2'-5' RNA ligase family protein [Nocardia asteroides]UGT60429.1 2'-5' RNA ligase family protein [Nocardia asteroides]